MADPSAVEILATKVAASAIGAAVSLRFIQGTRVERGLMFLGAMGASYFGTGWVSHQLGMADAEGLVGLLLGLYSMPVVAKVYESINLIDTKAISEMLVDRVKGFLGR